jgi:hypothetical protein
MTALPKPAATVNNRLVLSSERAPHINKTATGGNKNLVLSPRRMFVPENKKNRAIHH